MPITPIMLTHGPSDVEYHVTGSGPGLVLVHGTFANAHANWQPLIDEVADRYTIVAVNLPGSGASTGPGEVTVDDLARQVAAAAEHAGLETYHLVGHSLGAVTAATVAARHPQLVQSLVLHAPWTVTDARSRHQFELWHRLLGTDRELLAHLLQLTAFRPQATAGASDTDIAASVQGFLGMLAPGHASQLEADRTVDLRDLLPHIQAPSLVLVSTEDQIVRPADQHEVAHRIPGARTLEFGAGHALPFEDSTAFVKAIAEFLDQR